MIRMKTFALAIAANALLLGTAMGAATAQCAADLSVSALDRSGILPVNRLRGLDLTPDQPRVRDLGETTDIRNSLLRDLRPAPHKVGFILDRQTGPQSAELRSAVTRARDPEGGRYSVETLTMDDLGTTAMEDIEVLVFWNWPGELSARRIVQLDRFVRSGGRAVFFGGGDADHAPGGAGLLAAFGISHAGAIDPEALPEHLLHFYGDADEDAGSRAARLDGRRDIFATIPGQDPELTQSSAPMHARHSFAPAREDCGYRVAGSRYLTDGTTQIGMTARPRDADGGALLVISDWRFAAHQNVRISGQSVTTDDTLQSGLWAHPNCFLAIAMITTQSGLKACDPGPGIEAENLGLDLDALINQARLVMTGQLTVPRGLRRLELREGSNAFGAVVLFDPFENVADLARMSHTIEGPFNLDNSGQVGGESIVRTVTGELNLCAVPALGEPVCSLVAGATPAGEPHINLVSNGRMNTVSTDFQFMPEALEATGYVGVDNLTLNNPRTDLTAVYRDTGTRQCEDLPASRRTIGLPDLVHSSTAGIAHIESLVDMPVTSAALAAIAPIESFTVHLGAYHNPDREFPYAGDHALTGQYQSLPGGTTAGVGFAGVEIRGPGGVVVVAGVPADLRLVFNYFDPDSCLGQWIYGTTGRFTFISGAGDPGGRVAAAIATDLNGRPLMMEGLAFGSVITEPNIALSTGGIGDRRTYGQNIDGLLNGWLVLKP